MSSFYGDREEPYYFVEMAVEIEPGEDSIRIVWEEIVPKGGLPVSKHFDTPEEAAAWLDAETDRAKILFSHRDDEAAIEATLHDPEIYLGKAIFRIRSSGFPTTGIGTQL